MENRALVAMRIDGEVLRKLDVSAEREDLNRSQMVRRILRDWAAKFVEPAGIAVRSVVVNGPVEASVQAFTPIPEPPAVADNSAFFVDGVCESCVKGAHGGCYDGVRGVCNCDMEKCVGWKEKRRAMVSAEQSGWQAGV